MNLKTPAETASDTQEAAAAASLQVFPLSLRAERPRSRPTHPPNHLIKQIIIIKVIKLCTLPAHFYYTMKNRFKQSMETLQIMSGAVTLS